MRRTSERRKRNDTIHPKPERSKIKDHPSADCRSSICSAEAINILRGNIQLSGNHLQVIAITSANKEEGKSSVSIQLAKSFAALNRTTVYVDCDIRKSKTLRRYQINEQVVGLTEYLCGSCRIDDVVYRTDNPNMDMIFTGAAAPNPSELLLL